MVGNLYQVVAVETPLKKEAEEEGKLSKVVGGPFLVIALNDTDAAVKAARMPELKDVDSDRLELVLRPF